MDQSHYLYHGIIFSFADALNSMFVKRHYNGQKDRLISFLHALSELFFRWNKKKHNVAFNSKFIWHNFWRDQSKMCHISLHTLKAKDNLADPIEKIHWWKTHKNSQNILWSYKKNFPLWCTITASLKHIW